VNGHRETAIPLKQNQPLTYQDTVRLRSTTSKEVHLLVIRDKVRRVNLKGRKAIYCT